MSLVTPFIKPLQIAINRYLSYDPEAPKQLAKMNGKVVLLNFQPLDIKIYVLLTSDGVDLLDTVTSDADTTITGSPLALAMMNVQESSATSLFTGDVVIEGDIELGNHFQSFIKQVEVDWEEPLSAITGDVIANQLGAFVQSTAAWVKDVSKTNAMNIAEYAREEKRLLPSTFEVERFNKGVDDLRYATDRLEAKIQQFTARQQQALTAEKDAL